MTTDFKIKVLWHFIKSGMRNIRSNRQTRTRAIVAVVAFVLLFLLTMLSVPDGALAAFERGLYGMAFAIFGVMLAAFGTAAAAATVQLVRIGVEQTHGKSHGLHQLRHPLVGASSISFVSPQAAKLIHSAAPPLPTKFCNFAGTP